MGGGAQKSTILHSSLGDGGMPISLFFSSHLLIFIVLSHSSSLHPSICPRSVVMTPSESDRGGGGCCGKGSQVAGDTARQPE